MEPQRSVGQLVHQVLERPLMPGEDSLDDLERAFRATPVEMPKPRQKPALDEPAENEAARPAANRSGFPSIRSNG